MTVKYHTRLRGGQEGDKKIDTPGSIRINDECRDEMQQTKESSFSFCRPWHELDLHCLAMAFIFSLTCLGWGFSHYGSRTGTMDGETGRQELRRQGDRDSERDKRLDLDKEVMACSTLLLLLCLFLFSFLLLVLF